MARRRKRFGAVTGKKGGRGGRIMRFNVQVDVSRAHGIRGYYADACVKGASAKRARCTSGRGETATAASRSALTKLVNNLK